MSNEELGKSEQHLSSVLDAILAEAMEGIRIAGNDSEILKVLDRIRSMAQNQHLLTGPDLS